MDLVYVKVIAMLEKVILMLNGLLNKYYLRESLKYKVQY